MSYDPNPRLATIEDLRKVYEEFTTMNTDPNDDGASSAAPCSPDQYEAHLLTPKEFKEFCEVYVFWIACRRGKREFVDSFLDRAANDYGFDSWSDALDALEVSAEQEAR